MKSSEIQVPDNWILTNFGNKNLFEILGSGITFFENDKDYYSTSSIENDKLIDIEQIITYRNRPSRANMQPVPNSVWFAKMKNTLKVIQTNQYHIDNVIFSTGFCGIQEHNIDCSYLLQVLKSEDFNTKKDNLAEGTTQIAVNNQHVKSIEFLLPCSIFEQQKIASILSKLDEAITQTEQLIEKCKKIKEGLMHDLLTRGIDEQGNIRSEETHKFKDSPLGRIPVEWKVPELGQLSEITSGITLGKQYSTFGTKEMPYLRVANVQDGYFDLREIKTIRIPENQIDKYLLKTGDVLMNEGGDFDKLGRGSVWQEEIKDCLHQNHVFKVRLDKQLMNPQFLAQYSASEFGKRFFINESKKSTNLASINKSQLKKFQILKPKLDEQDRIINSINHYSNHINETTNNLNKLLSLKSGLMNDLLKGKVRVQI